MVNVSTMTMTMTMTFSSFVFRPSSFVFWFVWRSRANRVTKLELRVTKYFILYPRRRRNIEIQPSKFKIHLLDSRYKDNTLRWRKYQLWYTYVHLWYTYDILTCTYVQLDALMRALSCLNGVEILQECQWSDARMTERKCKEGAEKLHTNN